MTVYVYGWGQEQDTPLSGFVSVGKAWLTSDKEGAKQDLVLFARDAINNLGRDQQSVLDALQEEGKLLGDFILHAADKTVYFRISINDKEQN